MILVYLFVVFIYFGFAVTLFSFETVAVGGVLDFYNYSNDALIIFEISISTLQADGYNVGQ